MNIINKLRNRAKWLLSYPMDWVCRLHYGVPNVKNMEATIERILETGASISRFGDGEFDLVCGRSIPFQEYDEYLSTKLKSILKYNDENFLVGIPDVFNGLGAYTKKAQQYFKNYWRMHRGEVFPFLDFSMTYYCSEITRPYMDLADKSDSNAYFERLKKIWRGKKAIIVEGDKSRLGVGNDLFDGCIEIRRILCPAINAFSKYDEIINTVDRFEKSWLVLIALGPTATALAYDLYLKGFQALDIGHVDIEYEWMKMGALEKVPIAHKYTNEAESMGGLEVSDVCSEEYDNQIIARIGC